jgi:hypothetical protein
MSINLTKIKSASFLPGLQNIGTSETISTVNGTIQGNGGNLIGSFLLYFPTPNTISVIRVNLPDAHGDLASSWFPLIGSIQLYDATSQWYLSMYVQNNSSGRGVVFDFLSNKATDQTLSGFRIHAFAHLYTYPWSTVKI